MPFKTGKDNPMFGKHPVSTMKGKLHTVKSKQKIAESHKGCKNGQWKGDEVGYDSLHDYIKRYIPKPKICLRCKQEGWIDLANISGEYKRNFNDWEWLCRSCHMKSDGRISNLKQYRRLK